MVHGEEGAAGGSGRGRRSGCFVDFTIMYCSHDRDAVRSSCDCLIVIHQSHDRPRVTASVFPLSVALS